MHEDTKSDGADAEMTPSPAAPPLEPEPCLQAGDEVAYFLGPGDPGYVAGAGQYTRAEVTRVHLSTAEDKPRGEACDLRFMLPNGAMRDVEQIVCGSIRFEERGRPGTFERR